MARVFDSRTYPRSNLHSIYSVAGEVAVNWYIKALENYFNFKSRARRKEYWMFALINVVCVFVIAFGGLYLKAPWLVSIYQILVAIPSLSVGVRRMHDTDRSGWFLLIPFYSFYLLCIDGDKKPNRFGPDPKVESDPAQMTMPI